MFDSTGFNGPTQPLSRSGVHQIHWSSMGSATYARGPWESGSFEMSKGHPFNWAVLSDEQMRKRWPFSPTKWRANEQQGGGWAPTSFLFWVLVRFGGFFHPWNWHATWFARFVFFFELKVEDIARDFLGQNWEFKGSCTKYHIKIKTHCPWCPWRNDWRVLRWLAPTL